MWVAEVKDNVVKANENNTVKQHKKKMSGHKKQEIIHWEGKQKIKPVENQAQSVWTVLKGQPHTTIAF